MVRPGRSRGAGSPDANGHRVGRRAAWGVADQIIFSLTSFALAIEIAHHGSAAQFGAFGIAYVIYTLALGTAEAVTAEVLVVRGSDLELDLRYRMLSEACGVASVAGFVAALVAGVVALAVGGIVAVIAFPIFALAPALFVQDVCRFGFFATGRPRSAVLNDTAWAITMAVGAVVLGGHASASSYVWLWAGAGAACGLLALVQLRIWPRVNGIGRWFRSHASTGGRFAGEYLGLYGAAQAVLIAVGAFAGLEASAGYRGAQLMFGPLQVMLSAVRLAVTPILVRAHEAGTGVVRRTAFQITGAGAAAAVVWTAILFWLPISIGRAILSQSWAPTHSVILYAGALNVASAIAFGAVVVLRATKVITQTFKIRAWGAVLVLIFGVAASPAGSAAALAGVTVGTVITALLLWRQATYALDDTPPRQLEFTVREVLSLDRTSREVPRERRSVRPLPGPRAATNAVPNVFVIGAMRAGTTSFCADLDSHPQIALSRHKEPWVLVRCHGDLELASTMYEAFFDGDGRHDCRVDGSTSYAMRPDFPDVPDLAYALCPSAKIIYIVRNPVDRAVSHYAHLRAWNATRDEDIDAALRNDPRLIDYGRYWWQLQPWLTAFGAEAVKVIRFEDYASEREATIRDVYDFLCVEPDRAKVRTDVVLNRSTKARTMRDPWRRLLISGVYQGRLRTRIPEPVRIRARDLLLPAAPAITPPSASGVDRIIRATANDCANLGEFLGRDSPMWDLEAARQRYG